MTEENWKAFEYEVEMFFETRKALGHSCKLDRITRNAFVESALLHTRILVESLLSKKNGDDDITLNRLLVTANRPAELDPLLGKLRDRYGMSSKESSHCWTLNKRLAHLTAARGDSWNYADIFEEIDPLVQEILTTIIPSLGRSKLSQFA